MYAVNADCSSQYVYVKAPWCLNGVLFINSVTIKVDVNNVVLEFSE